jgi:glycosyltransferase involved in cell wall biosynthesis
LKKEISIIVPVYNVEGYLRKCIDSILKQTFIDFELILINDGSTDKSGVICDEYAKLDSRIIVVHQPNAGLSIARNNGISIAGGKYFSFIDSDDWVDENMLFEMRSQLVLYDADIIVAGHFIVNMDGRIDEIINVKNVQILDRVTATSLILKDRIINSFAWDKLYKRELFDNCRYPENRLFEDTATTYKLFNKSSIILQINRAYYFYLRRESSICLTPEFSKVVKRKFDNYLAFLERYEFTLANIEYLHVVCECQAKAFNHGQQFLHFIVLNQLDEKDFSFYSIIAELSKMKTIKNNHLTLAQKFEHQLMKRLPNIYKYSLSTYYSFKLYYLKLIE